MNLSLRRLWAPLTPEQRFARAARAARWADMASIASEAPQAALGWRRWDALTKEPIDALCLASRVGLPELVEALSRAGAAANEIDAQGESLLHQMARRVGRDQHFRGRAHCACAKALARAPEPLCLNASNPTGITAIALCARLASVSLLRHELDALRAQERFILTLAELGADPFAGAVGSRAADMLTPDILTRCLSLKDHQALRQSLHGYGSPAPARRL